MHGPMNDISFILLTLQFQQCQIIKITEQLLIKTVVLLLLLLLLFGFRTEYEEDKKKCRWKACGIHFDTIFKVLDFICYALINLDSIADEPEKIAFSHRRVRATPIHLPYWISARFSLFVDETFPLRLFVFSQFSFARSLHLHLQTQCIFGTHHVFRTHPQHIFIRLIINFRVAIWIVFRLRYRKWENEFMVFWTTFYIVSQLDARDSIHFVWFTHSPRGRIVLVWWTTLSAFDCIPATERSILHIFTWIRSYFAFSSLFSVDHSIFFRLCKNISHFSSMDFYDVNPFEMYQKVSVFSAYNWLECLLDVCLHHE